MGIKKCCRCGKDFLPERATKKYCNETCRKYAYLERNVLTLQVKKQGLLSINDDREKTLASIMLSPDSEIDDKECDFASLTLNPDSINDDKEEVLASIPLGMGSIIDDKEGDLTSITLTPDSIIDDKPDTFQLELEPKMIHKHQKKEKEVQNEMRNDAVPIPGKPEMENLPEYKAPEIIQMIEERIAERSYCLWFKYPDKRWNQYEQVFVRWTNERVKCLLDNLLRLTYKPSVNELTLKTLSNAFSSMTSSFYYRNLPGNYPYRETIESLTVRLPSMIEQMGKVKKMKFCLSLQRKAELITILWEMGKCVPKKKFSELDFK
jgi:hypothetical protein